MTPAIPHNGLLLYRTS